MYAVAHRLDHPGRLVTEQEREVVVDPTLAVVEVGVADAAGLDLTSASPGPGSGTRIVSTRTGSPFYLATTPLHLVHAHLLVSRCRHPRDTRGSPRGVGRWQPLTRFPRPMHMDRSRRLLPLAILVVALAMGGCGTAWSVGDADDPATSSASDPTSTPPEATATDSPPPSATDPASPTAASVPMELTTEGLATGPPPAVEYIADTGGGEQPITLIRRGGPPLLAAKRKGASQERGVVLL